MCQYCDSWFKKDTLYQKNPYGNLLIGNGLDRPVLMVDNIRSSCPQYADCASKDTLLTIVYKINYCPECGRKLKE